MLKEQIALTTIVIIKNTNPSDNPVILYIINIKT